MKLLFPFIRVMGKKEMQRKSRQVANFTEEDYELLLEMRRNKQRLLAEFQD